ncbi:MAG: type 1 glutamine amidotransferase [Leptolyngbya sp. BL-A-14]
MTKQRSQLQLLLLQIRDDAVTCQEELDEFVRYSRLEASQFTVLNTFATPTFAANCIEGYDALLVGGSSDASVTQPEKYPFVEDTKRLLLYCLEKSIPVFASCFGFQAAVEALGGKVVVDAAAMEMGTYLLKLTEAAATDDLFHDVPDRFWAVSGHKERALSLPEGAVSLAYSKLCPYHAFRIIGKPFYGFQFHPEVDVIDLTKRITRYQERYLESAEALAQVLQGLQETPIANQLIEKFVDRIVLAGEDGKGKRA